MEIVIKAGTGSESQMVPFITEIFYCCLWPEPRGGLGMAKHSGVGTELLYSRVGTELPYSRVGTQLS